MTAPSSFGRRNFPRVQVCFDVDVRVVPTGSHARTVGGRVVVLGAGGALLELDDAFSIGSLLHVRFELPTLGEIGCRAVVRNAIEDTGVGVEFLEIEGVEHRRIVAFVTKHQVDLAVQAANPETTELTSAQAFEALLASVKRGGGVVETPARAGDQRRSARYDVQLPVRYRWPDGSEWLDGTTANISETGLLFALDAADPRIIRDLHAAPDDPLRLALTLDTTSDSQREASISCSAKYVRTTVAPGRLLLSAIGVVVDTWQVSQAAH